MATTEQWYSNPEAAAAEERRLNDERAWHIAQQVQANQDRVRQFYDAHPDLRGHEAEVDAQARAIADRAEWQTASGEDRGREIARRTRAVQGLEAGPSHEHGERTGDQAPAEWQRYWRPSQRTVEDDREQCERYRRGETDKMPGISGMVIELQKKRRGAVE